MALSDLLVTLANNQKLYITLNNKAGDKLITFNAAGYSSVESDLGSRVVNRIELVSANEITITLEDAA